eukprot:gene12093-8318_t
MLVGPPFTNLSGVKNQKLEMTYGRAYILGNTNQSNAALILHYLVQTFHFHLMIVLLFFLLIYSESGSDSDLMKKKELGSGPPRHSCSILLIHLSLACAGQDCTC